MTHTFRTLLVVSLMSAPAAAARPGFGFELHSKGVELQLVKTVPNTAKNPKHTRVYAGTVKKGTTFTLDVGQYLMGGGLPKPQRVEIAAPTGEWKHAKVLQAKPTKLDGEALSRPGPTTAFTALQPGKSTIVFELDDRPNPKRRNLSAPTHVVWRFEVVLTVE